MKRFRQSIRCVACLTACGAPPPLPSPAPAPAPVSAANPRTAYDHLFDDTFLPVERDGSGSGVHGAWETDRYGLPVYRYTINQMEDPRDLAGTGTWSSRRPGEPLRWEILPENG